MEGIFKVIGVELTDKLREPVPAEWQYIGGFRIDHRNNTCDRLADFVQSNILNIFT